MVPVWLRLRRAAMRFARVENAAPERSEFQYFWPELAGSLESTKTQLPEGVCLKVLMS
jgi:hypothetical protein